MSALDHGQHPPNTGENHEDTLGSLQPTQVVSPTSTKKSNNLSPMNSIIIYDNSHNIVNNNNNTTRTRTPTATIPPKPVKVKNFHVRSPHDPSLVGVLISLIAPVQKIAGMPPSLLSPDISTPHAYNTTLIKLKITHFLKTLNLVVIF